MDDLQKDMQRVQAATHEAYIATGGIMALLDSEPVEDARLALALDRTAGKMEQAAVEVRNLCERHRPRLTPLSKKRPAPGAMEVAGTAAITEHGWLHLALSGLLPHCTREAPVYLTDTIVRLLDELEDRTGSLPWFRQALLVIDEHCDFKADRVMDQDNKGWKAVPNAMKGRLFEDDDQFTLGLALLSRQAERPCCHIYLLPMAESDDFFYMRTENIPIR